MRSRDPKYPPLPEPIDLSLLGISEDDIYKNEREKIRSRREACYEQEEKRQEKKGWHPDNLLMADLGIWNPIKLVWLFIVVMFLISFVVRLICAIQGTSSGVW